MKSLTRLKSQKGFSLVELILAMVIMSIMAGVTSQILTENVQAFNFIKNRQAALSDIRYALNLISNEMLRIPENGIVAVSASQIQYQDTTGSITTLSVGTSNGVPSLMRGTDPLVSPVQSLSINAYDQNGQATYIAGDVRRVEIAVATQPLDDEGSIAVTTTVVPRVFVYENYQ